MGGHPLYYFVVDDKLVLLRRPSNGGYMTGLNRYADTAEDCLRENSADFDIVNLDLSMRDGFSSFILNGLFRPFRSVFGNRSEDRVYHATDELCGVLFPFTRGKKVLTLHHVMKKGEYRGTLYYMAWYLTTAISLKYSDRVIAISSSTRNEIIEKFGTDPSKVVCIPNKISDNNRILEDVEKENTIACMGALIPRKNMIDSVRAFNKLLQMPGMSEYKLIICGDGPLKKNLTDTIRSFGIEDKVQFISNISDEEMILFYNRAKIIFNTSLREGLGVGTLEAQKCGTPTFHLEHAEIPKESVYASISCSDALDMATKAHVLLTSTEEYGQAIVASKEYAEKFGRNWNEQYMSVIAECKGRGSSGAGRLEDGE